MCGKTNDNNKRGYVALITAILVSVSLLIMVIAVSFEGYFSRFTVFDSDLKEKSTYLAEACVNTAILKLAQDINYSGGEMIPVGSETCEIVSIGPGTFPNPPSNYRRIKAQGIAGDAYSNLEVEIIGASFPSTNIYSWEEVATF